MKTRQAYEKYLMPNYGTRKLVLTRGEGVHVWDDVGKKYMDFGGGIAVLSLGHCNKALVKRIEKQLKTLGHTSNLYMTGPHAELGEKLVRELGPGKVFFCNSGAEANEALLKAARLSGAKVAGKEGVKTKVITAVNGFHGRTFATLSATAQAKIQKGFVPLVPNFEYAEYNNLKSFEKLMDRNVAAILVEPVQGESGILPAHKEFLKGLRRLCDKFGAMLLFDEIQTGVGRSGKFAAFQKFGVKPDGISLAKGLGGGIPIGAIWLAKPYADVFTPGSHGTTFGGNAIACAAGCAVMDEIKSKKLCDNADKMGKFLLSGLKETAKRHPDKILDVRGVGLMIGVLFKDEFKNTDVGNTLIENGLILVPAGANALRFLPPLNVKKSEAQKALKIFEKTMANL